MDSRVNTPPDTKWAAFVQFIKFGIVGVSNTLVNYAVYIIFVSLGVNYLIANTFGFIISVLNAYFWGSRFVFKEDKTKEKRVWWKVLLKTYAAYLLGFFLNQLFLIVWIDLLDIGQYFGFAGDMLSLVTGRGYSAPELSRIMAPILNIFITVPINFVINKFWAYRQKKIPDKAKVPENTDDKTSESGITAADIERS